MLSKEQVKHTFEPLTQVIAYVFGFLITAVAICIGLVLYIDSIPGTTTATDAAPAIEPIVVQLNDQEQLGKELFKSNCASCHKLNGKAVGPALAGVTDKYEREWLYPWIKNSAAMIASGDPRAVAIYNEYNQTNMNSFPLLTDEDIEAILAYTDTGK